MRSCTFFDICCDESGSTTLDCNLLWPEVEKYCVTCNIFEVHRYVEHIHLLTCDWFSDFIVL